MASLDKASNSKSEVIGKVNPNPFGAVKLKNPERKDYQGPTFSFEKNQPRKSSIKADFKK